MMMLPTVSHRVMGPLHFCLELEPHPTETTGDFGQNALFIGWIPGRERYAEAQVSASIIPRNGGNQLLRDQPLGDFLGVVEGHTRTVRLDGRARGFDVKEKRTLRLARVKAGGTQ